MFKLINNREPMLGQRQLGFYVWIFKLLFTLHKFAGTSISIVFAIHKFRVSFMIGTINMEELFGKTKRKGKTYDA
tara:strand:- start:20477 stop:20701 length:225 start_codon:yes stop_codon:yes gene_type:complete